jgi:uncharacterized small protein (TIGR04563 family)
MASADKRKQSLYFPEEMLKEIQDEANRQDRSLSWIEAKSNGSPRSTTFLTPATTAKKAERHLSRARPTQGWRAGCLYAHQRANFISPSNRNGRLIPRTSMVPCTT